jgi:hypothetical protein
VQQGSREALELLIARHQSWIYNIVLRMVYNPYDAEDATQEILIKLLTTLSTFEGRSRFPHLAVPHRRQPRAEHEADTVRGVGLDVREVWQWPGQRARPGPSRIRGRFRRT